MRIRALPYTLSLLCLSLPLQAIASGCIVVRPTAPLVFEVGDGHRGPETRWEYSISYRYLFSDRHFRGSHEEPERQARGTDVRNSVHTFDHTLGWQMNEQWRFTASMPVQFARRSSLYEHDRVNRHTMQANGIGDLRLMAYRDFRPEAGEGNGRGFTLGLGLKLPTGDDSVQDTAFLASGPVQRNVDQSIQPGDGGTGVIIELQGYQQFGEDGLNFLFASGSYLINPSNTNGVATHRGRPSEAIMSVPDSYQFRTGLARVLSEESGLTSDFALRLEGVPPEDLIGGSDGFRRPGHALYLEPGLTLERGVHRFNVSAPVAIDRNRTRSVSDRLVGGHGDAAFADWLLQLSYSYRW